MKHFLTHSNNPERSAVVWNMVASIAMAFQSVILLVVISNTPGLGIVPAGIFTMGHSLNNLFICIGKYGTRVFQVSDVKREYTFKTYRLARIISVLLMALISLLYVLINRSLNAYSFEKTIILIWMCFYKLPDAYEDVYYGEYQRNNRLDVASKATSIRLVINIFLWSVLLMTTKNMVISVIVTTIVTCVIMCWFITITKEFATDETKKDDSTDKKSVLSLLWVTLPIALSSFLAIYIGTAPRMAIDKLMDDTSQAIYGYIVMPIFVVELLLMFVLNPAMYKFSRFWDESNISGYIKETIKHVFVIAGLTIVCMLGAWLFGVPILSVLYNKDMEHYKMDIVIMMLSGGFLALSTLLIVLLTIMRQQKYILIGFVVASVFETVLAFIAVSKNGVRGAINCYLFIVITLCIIYLFGYIFNVVRSTKIKD
ncbi:Membrane protein involved in the export of O-antigen and teichoic acid [Lachnospiraceae bacterium]|nr:Membrane protein involved in the export of O-antigen and teichoic acid [Lachnospiraceae bacterium]